MYKARPPSGLVSILPSRLSHLSSCKNHSRLFYLGSNSINHQKSYPTVYRSIRMSSTTQTTRPVLIVAGIGNGSGTGASTAREFAKVGYSVALVARNADHLKALADEIKADGGDAAAFPVQSYDYSVFAPLFSDVSKHFNGAPIRVAVWNAGSGVFKHFLDISEEEVRTSLDTNAVAAFGFARAAILAFKGQEIDDANGKRGTLIFTGATAAIRGNVLTSAFAAGKFALRALSQSLAKEFGKENIHVAHAIIDGSILTKQSRRKDDPGFLTNDDIRLRPESIAKSYLYLVNQDRSSWTWELDLRPAHEKW